MTTRMNMVGEGGVILETDSPPARDGNTWLFGMSWDDADTLLDRLERARLHWRGPVEARSRAWQAYDCIEAAMDRMERVDNEDARVALSCLREARMHLEQSLKGLNPKEADE